jgi:allophanate hydrolase subunit 2
MIEILATGALATVQDHGRGGALKWGVGASGALDNLALAAGNILLGNDEHAAGIEMPIAGLRSTICRCRHGGFRRRWPVKF